MFTASLFLLWIVVILMIVAVAALMRQVRLMQERIAPIAMQLSDGMTPGDATPVISAATLAGDMLTIGGTNADGRAVLLLFIEADCTICDSVIGDALALRDAMRVRLLFLGEGSVDAFAALMRRHGMRPGDVILNGAVGADFRVGILPSIALLDSRGRLLAKGMIQTREQMEAVLALVQPVLPAEPTRTEATPCVI